MMDACTPPSQLWNWPALMLTLGDEAEGAMPEARDDVGPRPTPNDSDALTRIDMLDGTLGDRVSTPVGGDDEPIG